MQYVSKNATSTHRLDFLVDEQYIVPDVNSVFWTLFDQDSNVLQVDTAAAHGNKTYVDVTVSALLNATTETMARRWIVYHFALGGRVYVTQFVYTISNPVLLISNTGHVRAELGLTPSELPDSEIDLTGTYLELRTAYSTATVEQLDEAAVLAEALRILPTAQARALQTSTSGTETAVRAKVDWGHIEDVLRGRYFTILDAITNMTGATRTYAAVSSPTDPVFGDASS